VASYVFAKQNAVEQSLGLTYEWRQPAATTTTAAELYLNPLSYFGVQRNPFQHENRNYPVDMGMLQQDIIRVTLTLPPGYVAELPKPVSLALPNNGGRYMYSATSTNPTTVQLVSRLTFDKPVYSAVEYGALRELYRLLLAKQAEAIIIKKAG
jgi:hypothetical protein